MTRACSLGEVGISVGHGVKQRLWTEDGVCLVWLSLAILRKKRQPGEGTGARYASAHQFQGPARSKLLGEAPANNEARCPPASSAHRLLQFIHGDTSIIFEPLRAPRCLIPPSQ